MKKIKILHITDALGGGVLTAINLYISHTSECEHYLLSSQAKHKEDSSEIINKFVSHDLSLSTNPIKAIYQIIELNKKVEPTYIHLHSSYAGLYGRLSFIKSSKIIYTPHGYAFQRKDINIFLRSIFYLFEFLLSKISNKSIIATCGPGELSAASKISKYATQLYNFADCPKNIIWDSQTKIDKTICMVGRICPQKGIDYFIETSLLVKKNSKFNYRFIWIGDGELLLKNKLLENNIEVLGWKDRLTLLDELSRYNIYFHSAAWDGLPISLLEAAQIGLPLVVRQTEATAFIESSTVKSASEASIKIIDFCENKVDFLINNKLNTLFTQKYLENSLKLLYKPDGI